MKDLLYRVKPFLFLLLIVVFGYSQLSFFVYAVKWDFIDVVFPFRFFFSESVQAGYFPFWNPYLQTGSPFFADLQAPVFYPELLLVALFTGYSTLTLNLLFVAYALIAALGMYQLAFYFNQDRKASLLAAIAYAFSGYFVGHGQHLFLLVGAAWIPFVLVNYLRLMQNKGWLQSLKTAVFIFLMISGGYQALSFALFYLLLLLFIYFLLQRVFQRDMGGVLKIIQVNFRLFFIVVLFSLPLIVATLEILSSVERLEAGVSLTQTTGFGQSINSVISFFLPSSTLKYPAFFGDVDLSMRNHYFGLIPLLFFVAALFQKRTVPEYLILGFGVVIFASSFSILPLRELMFRYVPLMNLFKYAAFLRIFGLLAFILLAANYFSSFQKFIARQRNFLIGVTGIALLALTFLLVYAFQKVPRHDWKLIQDPGGFIDILENISFHQHIVIQGLFQIVITLLFLFVLLRYKRLKHWRILIVLIAVTELLVAARTNLSFTAGDRVMSPFRMQKDLSLYPEKFPIPVNSKITFNDQHASSFPPFWRNTYVFSKQVSFNAFSSFELKSYSMLDDHHPNLREATLNNHLFYFSDEIRPMSQFNDSIIDKEKEHRVLYLFDDDFRALSDRFVKRSSGDRVEIVSFAPNRIDAITDTREDQYLTLLQTYFKGWKATIDGEPVKIYASNYNYRTLFLPKGNHQVCFTYENRRLIWLYIFSNSLFFISLLFFSGIYLRKMNVPGKIAVVVPLVLLLFMLLFLMKRLTWRDENLTVAEYYERRREDKRSLFSYKQDFESETEKRDAIAFSGINSKKITSSDEYIPIASINNEDGTFQNGTLVVKLMIHPEDYSKALIVSDIVSGDEHKAWFASRLDQQIEKPGRWNTIWFLRNVYDLSRGDVIQIYLWNLNKDNMRMDDVEVDFYADF